MKLFAWIGEDEFGSGVVGLKAGMTNAGVIPLVVIEEHRYKIERPELVAQLQQQADAYGKTIRLAEFTLTADALIEVRPT